MSEKFKNMHEHSISNILRYPDEYVVRFFAGHEWSSVLDFGCSNGRHTQMLCELSNSENNVIWAIDLDERVLEIVKQRAPRAKTTLDINEIPSSSLDYALLWHMIYMSKKDEQKKILNQVYKLLKDDGSVILSYRSPKDSVFSGKNEAVNEIMNEKIYSYELDEILELLSSCGFEVTNVNHRSDENIITKNTNAYFLIVAKKC